MEHWVAGVEFYTLVKELRVAGVPEESEGPASIAKFILNANVAATSQEQYDDESWQTSKLATTKRGAAAMIDAVQARPAATTAGSSGKDPKRPREEDEQSTSPGPRHPARSQRRTWTPTWRRLGSWRRRLLWSSRNPVSSNNHARVGYEREPGHDTSAHENEQRSQSAQFPALCPSEACASV